MFFWFLFWIAVLGAFAVFIDPCIVAGIVAVYLVITVGWIVASILIFVAVIFTICFFTACALKGHPEWLVWCRHTWANTICVRWPWLPPWVDTCAGKLDTCRKHKWVDPFWSRCVVFCNEWFATLNWDVNCHKTCSFFYQILKYPWPKNQKKKLQ